MKKIIIFALVAVCLTAHAQLFSKKDIKRMILTSSCMVVSGAAEGTSEALRFHYSGFKRVFPDADDQFWNAAISHTNKYKNHDPTQGPAFWGSKSFLVWKTDGYHAMKMVRNVTMITGVVIRLGEPQRWYKYMIEGVIYYLAFNAGFTLTYDVIFK